MTRELVTLAAAALAMAFAAPVCAAVDASNAPAQPETACGIKVAENSASVSSTAHAGGTNHRHHHRSHHSHHHRHTSQHHQSRHHSRSAAEDPKAGAPEAAPTAGVIPRISP
jgi:hypothetical protein